MVNVGTVFVQFINNLQIGSFASIKQWGVILAIFTINWGFVIQLNPARIKIARLKENSTYDFVIIALKLTKLQVHLCLMQQHVKEKSCHSCRFPEMYHCSLLIVIGVNEAHWD